MIIAQSYSLKKGNVVSLKMGALLLISFLTIFE